jgi:hypothetical protein
MSDEVTLRALAVLQACSSSDEDDDRPGDVAVSLSPHRDHGSGDANGLNSAVRGGLNERPDISLHTVDNERQPTVPQLMAERESHRESNRTHHQSKSKTSSINADGQLLNDVVNSLQFASQKGGRLIFDPKNMQSESVNKSTLNKHHRPQFTNNNNDLPSQHRDNSPKYNAPKPIDNKRRRHSKVSHNLLSADRKNGTCTIDSSSSNTKRKRLRNAEPSTNRSINHSNATHKQIQPSKYSLSQQLQDEFDQDAVTPHELHSQYHNLQIFTSIPFDSRAMISMHRAKEFEQPLRVMYEDYRLHVMSQKSFIQRERNKKIDGMEEDLLDEIELLIDKS